jgi:polyisoprenoid-binding protein YceI
VARYLIKEQLIGAALPGEAIGSTTAVRGQVVLEGGVIQPGLTKFTVDLSTLRSDDDRRDIYMRRTTLDTVRFPNAEFFLREVRGLPGPLPSSGSVPFQLVGDMTVKGVTSTVVWDVFVTLTPEGATGKATTNFPGCRWW